MNKGTGNENEFQNFLIKLVQMNDHIISEDHRFIILSAKFHQTNRQMIQSLWKFSHKSYHLLYISPFTHIVNLSLKTGVMPDCCKIAIVTPLLKGGELEHSGNYRPISIQPVLSITSELSQLSTITLSGWQRTDITVPVSL